MQTLLNCTKMLFVPWQKIMNEILKLKRNPKFNVRHIPHTLHIQCGIYARAESAYLRPYILEQIYSEIRNNKSIEGLKQEIKTWKPADCSSRICKISVPNLSFIGC